MWSEELGEITANHLRTHIAAYLADIESDYSDGVKLVQPRAIETANLVGGVYSVDIEKLPAYAVDVMSKSFVASRDDGWLYQYDGHIAMITSAQSEGAANRISKRHLRAVEKFVREHQFLHQQVINDECAIHEFGFAGSALSGAAKVDEENNRQLWVAGARVDVIWVTRESGFFDHGG